MYGHIGASQMLRLKTSSFATRMDGVLSFQKASPPLGAGEVLNLEL